MQLLSQLSFLSFAQFGACRASISHHTSFAFFCCCCCFEYRECLSEWVSEWTSLSVCWIFIHSSILPPDQKDHFAGRALAESILHQNGSLCRRLRLLFARWIIACCCCWCGSWPVCSSDLEKVFVVMVATADVQNDAHRQRTHIANDHIDTVRLCALLLAQWWRRWCSHSAEAALMRASNALTWDAQLRERVRVSETICLRLLTRLLLMKWWE